MDHGQSSTANGLVEDFLGTNGDAFKCRKSIVVRTMQRVSDVNEVEIFWEER